MQKMPTAIRLTIEGEFPSIGGATGWLNLPPLTVTGLHEKVVLVDFWTYSCINWLRTLCYVRAWAEKYKDQGQVVIGVHSPELENSVLPGVNPIAHRSSLVWPLR